MRTSVDRGIFWAQKPGWKQARRTSSIIVSLVVLCLIAAGAIGCDEELSKDGGLPEIVSFQANPPINEGDPISYTFEVKNATKIRLIEAGETIKEIDGLSSGIYKGAATGQAPSTVLTSDDGTLDAVLEASNEQGTVKKTATLSGSAVLKPNATQPPINNGWADRPCPTGCGCMTPQALPPCGSGCQCAIECQGPLNPTTKYCYRIPVQPCDTANGCTCMEPSHVPPNYIRCSDNLCAANPDKYCYRPACPLGTTCKCLLDTDVAPCGWTPCQGSSPCNNTGEPAKSCYKCPAGTECITPADAAYWVLDVNDHSACRCSRPGEPEMYCYHFPACDNTTGCVCRSDQFFINEYCPKVMGPQSDSQEGMWPCSDNACGQGKHCYRCPANCQCIQDGDPNRIPNGYTHRCNSNNKCTCLETSNHDWHCYHKPGQ
jgi:hypothetical protein